MIIVLLGPPGAGKGTQGERLAEQLKIPKIATGDVLRAAVRAGTEQGRLAKSYMERGDLVPDEVILDIMKHALGQPGAAQGAILDGVVRTVPQAEGLERVVRELGRRVNVVLMFEVSEPELVRRLSQRTVCEGCQTPYTGRDAGTACEKCGGRLVRRADDEPEAIRTRMQAYREQTAPVIEWYRRRGVRVCTIDADGPVETVTARVVRELDV